MKLMTSPFSTKSFFIRSNLAGALISICLVGFAEENSEIFDSTPYDLSPYIINGIPDLPKPEKWQYAKIDEFDVLCNSSQYHASLLVKKIPDTETSSRHHQTC